MSKVYRSGTSWPGFPSLRYLIIFGDSYSDVGYSTYRLRVPSPSASNPLGIEFPGMTYNEEGLPNWVGHLITKYSPEPRFDPSRGENQDPQYRESPLLVYDYATGGRTVEGVQCQVNNMFVPSLGQEERSETSWNASNSLFVTWVGINDCGMGKDPKTAMALLVKTQQALYDAGARNFLLIDVPPIHRSPAGEAENFLFFIGKRLTEQYLSSLVGLSAEENVASSIQEWNDALCKAIELFTESHEDISVFLFSSFQVFQNVLDDPKSYSFKSKDIRKDGGAIWKDRLHPTSKMHDVIASSIAQFLNQI